MCVRQYEVTEDIDESTLNALDFPCELKNNDTVLEVSGPAQLLDANPVLQTLNIIEVQT